MPKKCERGNNMQCPKCASPDTEEIGNFFQSYFDAIVCLPHIENTDVVNVVMNGNTGLINY